ncbi:cilia- and flagella-associated protein 299 [Drosophila busckii]|uniref:cilia- and flagella-associated protein 299 n=1 Tax=Drosophila busckii TaxID=30019 RepID=UPI0014331423|nr:cilia- and flagella-associated protein 299 [Drosophila busckii]
MKTDYALLEFKSHADYMMSLITLEDKRYLQNTRVAKKIAELGFRTNGKVYDEAEFEATKAHTLENLNPRLNLSALHGALYTGEDRALCALADREHGNLTQKLATIIFLLVHDASGFDLSSYIDYSNSLHRGNMQEIGSRDWSAIFEGRRPLRPKRSDLSFYDWHRKLVCYNNSSNYEVVPLGHALSFKHKGDHRFITIDTNNIMQNMEACLI